MLSRLLAALALAHLGLGCVPDLDRLEPAPRRDGGLPEPAPPRAQVDTLSATSVDAAPAPPPPPPPPACSGKPAFAAGSTTRTTVVGGITRSYLVHVPPGYDPERTIPLVLLFHGFTSNPKDQLAYSKLDAAADQRKVLVVAPQGRGLIPGWNAGGCCGEASLFQFDDVGFVKQVLAELRELFCLDEKRVFAAGMSNGAFFVNRLACELAEAIAAIGTVAGGLMLKSCTPGRPVSVLAFHGTADSTVPYQGGTLMGFKPAAETDSFWATHDGCQGAPEVTLQKGAVTCKTHRACSAGTEVSLCTIEGASGTHSWPGAGPWPAVGNSNMDIDATAAILDFFAQHPR